MSVSLISDKPGGVCASNVDETSSKNGKINFISQDTIQTEIQDFCSLSATIYLNHVKNWGLHGENTTIMVFAGPFIHLLLKGICQPCLNT